MEIEKMRKAIIDAVEKKEVSMRDLGHPGTIRRIIDGNDAKAESIQSAYFNLKAKNPNRIKSGRASSSAPRGLKQPATPEQGEPIAPIEQKPSAQYVSIEEFQSLKNEMDSLKEQIKELQVQPTSKPPRPQRTHKDCVLGFSISIYNTWTDGNKYEKYYATKRIKGKLHRIYLGSRADIAEDKIKQYCTKHQLELKESVEQ